MLCLKNYRFLQPNFTLKVVFHFLRIKIGKQPFLARKFFFRQKVGKQRFFASFWQTRDWQTTVHDLYLFFRFFSLPELCFEHILCQKVWSNLPYKAFHRLVSRKHSHAQKFAEQPTKTFITYGRTILFTCLSKNWSSVTSVTISNRTLRVEVRVTNNKKGWLVIQVDWIIVPTTLH